jgi:uncharacterized repeat protein (TIGR02543 family)
VPYSVAYAANGATSGAVPADAGSYLDGDPVTVLHNTGVLARTGYLFTGWNTAADGSGFFRGVGVLFNIGAADVTLYAQWAVESLVTVAQFKAYAKKPDGDATAEALYQTYIDAAEATVRDFLGYSPLQATYTAQTYYGDGYNYLRLAAKPVTALASITVDGASKTPSDFILDGETIIEKNRNIFPAGSPVVVTFTAGYPVVPPLIINAILEIASLKAMQAGEAIGVSSTSFDGGNTRSFVNYTSFDKYLANIAQYKRLRLGRIGP